MSDVFRAYCPHCDGERSCIIRGEFDQPWSIHDEQNHVEGQIDHKLIQCAGCELVFYYMSSWDDEDWPEQQNGHAGINYPRTIKTYPSRKEKSHRPEWVWSVGQIDPQLYKILDEIYKAFEAKSYILAAVGLRTAFDLTITYLKIDPGHTLEQKVKELLENGFIGRVEAETLAVVTNAGSAAAHQGWSPDQKTLKILITTLEQFVYRVVVTGNAALSLNSRIPARQPRPKKLPKPKT